MRASCPIALAFQLCSVVYPTWGSRPPCGLWGTEPPSLTLHLPLYVWSPVAREPLRFLRPLVKSQGAPSRPPSLECSRERSFDRFTVSLWSHRATGWRPWTLAFTVASVHGAASPGRCSSTEEWLGSSESPRRLEELVLLLGRPDAPAGHLKCLLDRLLVVLSVRV